jgi:hypothetical protein
MKTMKSAGEVSAWTVYRGVFEYRGQRTIVVVDLLELVKGAEDDYTAGDGAHAHGQGEAELLAGIQQQISDNEPREQG